jgi:hypothetical protein
MIIATKIVKGTKDARHYRVLTSSIGSLDDAIKKGFGGFRKWEFRHTPDRLIGIKYFVGEKGMRYFDRLQEQAGVGCLRY